MKDLPKGTEIRFFWNPEEKLFHGLAKHISGAQIYKKGPKKKELYLQLSEEIKELIPVDSTNSQE